MIELTKNHLDDPRFVQLINQLVIGLSAQYRPQLLYVIQVDNWFGEKWLCFTGKALGALGVWNKVLRVPPFRPNRILQQHTWELDQTGFTYNPVVKPSLHREQTSEQNHYRFLNQVTDSGLFVWYSGQTSENHRGTVMVYHIEETLVGGWYASFSKPGEWGIYRTQEISPQQLGLWLTK